MTTDRSVNEYESALQGWFSGRADSGTGGGDARVLEEEPGTQVAQCKLTAAEHRPACIRLFHRHRCRRVDVLRSQAGTFQLRGQSHRKAAGMSRGDQLLGIHADAIFKPRAK